jgi:hypothetical protein
MKTEKCSGNRKGLVDASRDAQANAGLSLFKEIV